MSFAPPPANRTVPLVSIMTAAYNGETFIAQAGRRRPRPAGGLGALPRGARLAVQQAEALGRLGGDVCRKVDKLNPLHAAWCMAHYGARVVLKRLVF